MLQPGDSDLPDSWLLFGSAMERISRHIKAQRDGATPGATKLLGLQDSLLHLRGLQATHGSAAVFGPLGAPVTDTRDFIESIGLPCEANAPLFSHWEALGGDTQLLTKVTQNPHGLKQQFRTHLVCLQAGIHAGKVECYILRVERSERPPDEDSAEESPC